MARKSKYTPEVVQRLTLAIGLGATYELACNYAGIAYDTFRTWMNTKPAFSDTIKQAEGQGVTKWLAKIEQAASDGNWQAAAWKLERRYPKDYGRRIVDTDLTSGGEKLTGLIVKLHGDGDDSSGV